MGSMLLLCGTQRARLHGLTAMQTVEGRQLATLNSSWKHRPISLNRIRHRRNAVDALYNLVPLRFSCRLLGVMEKGASDHARLSASCANSSESPSEASRRSSTRRLTSTFGPRQYDRWCLGLASNNDPYRIDPAYDRRRESESVGRSARPSPKTCIQLHGAIGFADEHDIGLSFKRAMLLSSLLGNAAEQRRRYVKIAGLNA